MSKTPKIDARNYARNIQDNIRFKTIDIWIFYQAGYTYEEIARILQVSTSTVGKAVKKVNNHLKNGSIEDLLTSNSSYVKVK